MKERGIFARQKITYHPKSAITHLLSCNNQLVLVLKNGSLVRIPLQQPEKQTGINLLYHEIFDIIISDLEISNADGGNRIAYIFLDPTGKHLLFSTSNEELFYLHSSMQKAKQLSKVKGHAICAVAWNSNLEKDTETGFIVLGSDKGRLFETELTQSGQMNYLKPLHSLFPANDDNHSNRIFSLELRRCLATPSRWCLFVCTSGMAVVFAGNVDIHIQSQQSALHWVGTDSNPPILHRLFVENPRTHVLEPNSPKNGPNSLKINVDTGKEITNRFAWLTTVGVKYGKIDLDALDPYRIMQDQGLINHPDIEDRLEYPVDLTLTDFHVIILYENRLTAISTLNEHVMYEDILGQKFGKITGITRDPVSGIVWLFTDKSVLKYRPVDEFRWEKLNSMLYMHAISHSYLWKIHLDRGEYLLARQFTAGNQQAFDLVLKRHGRKLINEKKYS